MKNVIIMGAAGKDFHVFLTCYKDNPKYNIVCFTATQIPGIEKRSFPKKLAGKLYKTDIPIYPEKDLAKLIKKYKVNEVVFAYSDVPRKYVEEKSRIVRKAGAAFKATGIESMIPSKKPVIAVVAIRTGCGKSQTSRKIVSLLNSMGKKVVAIRHPMPYGDLTKQEVQRFETFDDLVKHKCTIEEREEYEPYIENGAVVFAGVDYAKILKEAEKEADIILWDGGNNDIPFYKPDLWITVADPLRAGDEISYYPGYINFEKADVIIINKENSAKKSDIDKVVKNAKKINPKAKIIHADSVISVDASIKGKKAIIVEDGPTLTHGGMKFGAGIVAAKKFGAVPVDCMKTAVGSIKEDLKKFSLKNLLPAMGYSDKQIKELEETINNTKADIVLAGTPINLNNVIKVNKPIIRVKYGLNEKGKGLDELLKRFIKNFIEDSLSKLSEDQLNKLAILMDVGFLQKDLDKDEKILVLSTEPKSKILKALKRIKN